ncbi:unnamed protein product [Clavelina lepadiformis]|uniref:Protein FAM92A n=2 Tax=Clavelina lepadiformis TaxID=159417 RepID=A0ABP0GD22_CLALP
MNFSRGPLTPEARAREAQSKFMEESVQKVQKYFGLMCNEMGGICRKTGRLRDKYDALAKTCLDYANVETGPLNKSLTKFAEHISAIQDYRQAELERLERKVVDPLSTYGSECKHTQDDLNKSFKARNRELKQQQRVENVHHKSPSDRHAITLAEAELQKRTLDVARTTRTLEETVDRFEVKKIQDLKNILSEFVKIEMLFHAKALEVYTTAYSEFINLDEEEHIEMFRNTLRPQSSMQKRMDVAKNLGDITLSDETQQSGLPTPKPRAKGKAKKRTEVESEDDDDVDEEEDEEDDEGDWGSEEEETEDDYEEDL